MIFHKYQGAGNDFIIIDNRNHIFEASNNELVKKMCNRRTGIGADGLLLLENHKNYDFVMRYFNADGYEVDMCGNGARCIVKFARSIGIIDSKAKFLAGDGIHEAIIEDKLINLKMKNVENIIIENDYYLINTGVPHYVCFRKNINDIDVYSEGKKIRYSDKFTKEGINVNFVNIGKNALLLRTYERGVEDETLACGTGIVASAIIASIHTKSTNNKYTVLVKGGILEVSFSKKTEDQFENIWLRGPANMVYKGEY